MNSKRGSQFLTILPRPISVCFLVFAYRSPGLQVFRRLSCVDHDCQQWRSPYLQEFYPIWDSVSFHFCLREASLESWPRPRESLLYFSLPRLAVLFPIENVRNIINPSQIDQSRLQCDYKRMSNPATIPSIGNQILGTCFCFNPDRIGPIIWQSTKNVAIRLQFQINPNLTAHRQVLGLESRAGSYPCSRDLYNPTGRPQSPKGPVSES